MKKKTPKLITEIGLLRALQGDIRGSATTQTDQGAARMISEDTYKRLLSVLDSVCDQLSKRR